MKKEIWKQLVYNGITYLIYEVSNLGHIRTLTRFVAAGKGVRKVQGRITTLRTNNKQPHLFADTTYYSPVYDGLQKSTIYVHKAVAIAFIPNPENKAYVSHKNGDYSDNSVENLYWITHSELQIRNMETYPELRNGLRDRNIESGFYKKYGRLRLPDELISNIKISYSEGNKTMREIAELLDISVASVFKYK